MIVEFLPEAKSELVDAVAYYEGELSGLGQRIWDEVDQHITWIAGNYEIPSLRPGGYRRVNLKIFPYYISYVVRDQIIWILAIAHGHSRPEYWIDRPKAID
jgi:ParE toxin of type II toxin-antitoxin system, parDE